MILTILMLVNSSFGQLSQEINDSQYEKIARDYLVQSIGKNFIKENISFLGIYHSGLTVAVFETHSTKNIDGCNTFFVYFKYLQNKIDTLRTIIDKNEIIKRIKGDSCNLLIGIDKAKEIAEKTGLKKGREPYKIDLISLGENGTPTWVIESTYTGSRDGNKASGEYVSVSMIDGKAELGLWSMIE